MRISIRPTTTQRVRGFLAEQGLAPKPWASLDETYASLYRLLRVRADDNAFWRPLSGLLRDLVADAADGPRRLPAPQAELLRSWDVEDLLRDLRCALPGRCAPAGDHRGFARSLGAPVLGGFLALGLAASGCDEVGGSDLDASTDQDGGDDAGSTWSDGCALDAGSPLYALIDTNEGLTATEKSVLCNCMASMPTAWQTDLSEVFATCVPATIAAFLEELVAQCEAASGALGADPSTTASTECDTDTGVAYKGVAFPS
jgi:hypothetical protein